MRACSFPAARILTLFTLAVLSAQSFTLVNAQSSAASDASSPSASLPLSQSIPTSIPSIVPTTSVPSATETTSATPSQSSVSSASASQSSAPVQSSSTQDVISSSSAAPSSASSVSSASSAVSSSPPSSSAIPSATPSSSSAAIASSSSSVPSLSSQPIPSSSPASSAALQTVYTTSVKAPVSYAPPISSATYLPATQGIAEPPSGQGISTVSGVVGADATGSAATSSNKSFFDNKAAVAGVFTVVGLIGVGCILAVVLRIVRRRNRYNNEDTTYFEKDLSNGANFGDAGNTGEDNASMTEVVTHASSGAYPDRTSHYGMPAFADDTQPRDSIVEYAKGTAYAAARAQAGPYQYSAPNGAYGGEFTNAHYQAQAATPYGYQTADPYSIARPGTAAGYGHGAIQQSHHPYADAYLVDTH